MPGAEEYGIMSICQLTVLVDPHKTSAKVTNRHGVGWTSISWRVCLPEVLNLCIATCARHQMAALVKIGLSQDLGIATGR